jgi:hypothetical protein
VCDVSCCCFGVITGRSLMQLVGKSFTHRTPTHVDCIAFIPKTGGFCSQISAALSSAATSVSRIRSTLCVIPRSCFMSTAVFQLAYDTFEKSCDVTTQQYRIPMVLGKTYECQPLFPSKGTGCGSACMIGSQSAPCYREWQCMFEWGDEQAPCIIRDAGGTFVSLCW